MPYRGNNEESNTNENNTNQAQQERMRELSNIQSFLNANAIFPQAENPRAERRQEAPAAQNRGNARPEKPKSLWGTIKHGLFSGLAALSAATVGGFFWLVSYPFTRTDKYKKRLHGADEVNDTDIIPGSKNKEKFYTPDVENGSADQEILNDNRRVPLIFEREIFEDVNAAPTVTFNFQQGREGDSSSLTSSLPSLVRRQVKVGHASITMKYTRKDPLTGQMKRYQTSFGFAANTPPSFANGVAQQFTDTYVPGVMTDDFNNPMTIGKEYPIDNKTINKLILKAQGYEKGGYQVIKRNCAAFAAEMAETAGIPEAERDMIFQKTDFKLDPGIAIAGAGIAAFIAAPALVRIGKAQAMSLAGQVNPSWGRFGQTWLPMEDANHIENTEFSTRLYGYAPSQGGEALRKLRNVGLHSDAYGNEILNMQVKKNGDEKPTAEENLRLQLDEISKLFNKEIHNLEKTLNKKFRDNPENANVINSLRDFSARFSEASGAAGAMFTAESLSGRRNAAKNLWSEIHGCYQNFNQKYLDHYQGTDVVDPKVNIAFQHMASVFSNMQKLVMRHDEIQRNNLCYGGFNNRPQAPAADYGEFIDMTRDSAEVLKPFVFQYGNMTKKGYALSCEGLSEIGAGLLTFGSLDTFYQYKSLLFKEKKSKQEQKVFEKLGLKAGALKCFKKAQLSYAGDRHFSKSDYKLAMVDLPKAMKNSGLEFTDDPYSPDKAYQMIAFERIFGGMKKAIYDEFQREGASLDSLKAVIGQHIADSLQKNKEEYNTLAGVCIDEYVRQAKAMDIVLEPTQLSNYKECILEKTNEMIMNTLRSSYLVPLINKLESDVSKNIVPNENNIKVGDMMKLDLNSKDFSKVHQVIHEQTGIQPVLSARHAKVVRRINDKQEWKDKDIPKTFKENTVKELLSINACYKILLEAEKAPSFTGDVITNEMVDQIKSRITVDEKDLNALFKTARRCTKDFPLALFGEERDLLWQMSNKSKEFKDLMQEIKNTNFKVADKPAEKGREQLIPGAGV